MDKKGILLIVGCVLLVLAGAAVWAMSNFVFYDGAVYAKYGAPLDLRSEALTQEEYQTLSAKMPGREILWNVPFQGKAYPSDTQLLEVTSLSSQDVMTLTLFPELTMLDAEHCSDYGALMAFQQMNPACTVRYRVELNGKSYLNGISELRLQDADAAELEAALPSLPNVKSVALVGEIPSYEQITALQEAHPEITFTWEWEFEGQHLDQTSRALDLSGRTLDYKEVDEALNLLPELTFADMHNSSLTDQELIALADKYPQCFFLWDMTIGEFSFSTDTEEIDISGMELQSVEEIESLLPYFPNVKKVVMCRCGIDDETMDALNKRYEDIRFVWSVRIKYVYVRTDATWFYPYKFQRDLYVNNEELYPLRYCTDMVCIDIGHMGEVTDCEWAAFMPNLKYLIIGETGISDLTPLGNLKNLVYLEMFTIPVTDYSPLLGCTALEDLNLGKTYASAEPIAQMTWLKNLWWCDCATWGNPCSNAKDILPDALPNTTMRLYPEHPTASGWRQLPNYYAMRDYMDMFYLT